MAQNNSIKCIIILYSYHHNNTEKIANVFSKILAATIKTPIHTNYDELQKYDLIGFGAGIDSGKHYPELLEFADKLPYVKDKNCFIFSTSAVQGKNKVAKDHKNLREKLLLKGYKIIDEFSCKGYNTNSFLKYIGGMNKNRPNSDDLKSAENFAKNLTQKIAAI